MGFIGGGLLTIAIFSKDFSSDIVRLTMAYCQRWDCYPLIKHYSEKEELFDAIKSQTVNIAILNGNRKECDSIVNQIEKMRKQLRFIWLSTDGYQKTSRKLSNQEKQKYSSILEEKIEKELESCGIPSAKESLCRVHLKVE